MNLLCLSCIGAIIDEYICKILILEDDFVFNIEPEDLNLKLTCCINELPQNWDLFYLGAYFVKGYDYEAKINYSKNLYKDTNLEIIR